MIVGRGEAKAWFTIIMSHCLATRRDAAPRGTSDDL